MASSIQNNSPIFNKLNVLNQCKQSVLEEKIQTFINKYGETVGRSQDPRVLEAVRTLNAKFNIESEFRVTLTALEDCISANIQKASDPIQHVKDTLVEPVMNAVGEGVRALVEAHGRVNKNSEDPQLREKVHTAIGDLKTFLIGMLEDPNVIIKETLGYFGNGGGKRNTDVTGRRWVTAFNSGDEALNAVMAKDHMACCKGNDFTDIKELFESEQSNVDVLKQLPSLLLKHFSLTDEVLYEITKEILEKIFQDIEVNPIASGQLTKLRKQASSLSTQLKKIDPELTRLKQQVSDKKVDKQLADLRAKASGEMQQFIEAVQEFVVTDVFVQAKVEPEQLQTWHHSLSSHMLTEQTVFTQLICVFLATIAANSEIIGPMLNKAMPNKEFFSILDNIFITSESNDCICPETKERQEALIRLQCAINAGREPEARIALIAIPIENKTILYTELAKEFSVVACTLARKDWGQKKLATINLREDVLKLGQELNSRLIAVPCAFLDHPVQLIREYEQNYLEGGYGIMKWVLGAAAKLGPLRNFLLDLAKPGLHKVLPKMDAQLLVVFDKVVKDLADLITAPVLDGAILDKPFRRDFKEVMSTEGIEFANSLKEVIGKETISFEEIRDAMVNALRGMQEAFDARAKNEKAEVRV